ncbi:MAG: VWA domain-containing protein [Vicinamibacterales bacterium]
MPEQIRALVTALQAGWAEWGELRLADLQFSQAATARMALVALIGLAMAAFVLRLVARASASRGRVGLPALVGVGASSRNAWLRHGALVLALAGLPFFILALADPRTAITREEVSYPGRRISLMIDASSSMLTALPSNRFAEGAPNNAAFFTTVGAARYFIERRMNGQYRDLMALIEFGDDAYVITPFTTDYENILLSTSLIGDWQEFMSFPDQGSVVARAVEQSVAMFESFKYLDAAGNLMVLFTDGADAEVLESGKSVYDVVGDAQRAKIPIYFIKVGRNVPGRAQIGDELWKAAVERTGGHFYPAADEASIERAIRDIDRASAGRIEYRQYSTERPRFSPFALAAAVLWSLALLARMTVPAFATFP